MPILFGGECSCSEFKQTKLIWHAVCVSKAMHGDLAKNFGLEVLHGRRGHRAKIPFDAKGARSECFVNDGIQTQSDSGH